MRFMHVMISHEVPDLILLFAKTEIGKHNIDVTHACETQAPHLESTLFAKAEKGKHNTDEPCNMHALLTGDRRALLGSVPWTQH